MAELSFTNLDFENIKSNLKNYLKAQDKFRDYDFEGSNINVLLDVLAYNTFQNNIYTNLAISESFLDSAQIKDSVVSHAKELNYLPRSRRSARATLAIEFFPTTTLSTITIPEKTKFIARCGTRTFNFYNQEAYTVTPSANGQYVINNVDVYEGRYVEEFFEVDGTDTQRFILSNDTVDTNSIEVFVRENSGAPTETEYVRRNNVYNVDPTDSVFYLQPFRDNKYEVTFGDNIFGVEPVNGNIIRISYRVTSGADANGINDIDIDTDIDGISSTETIQSSSVGGAERESLQSIKFFAPKSIQIQERAITENDYAILLQNEFPEIQAISVFGGEKLFQPQYGRVVISVFVNNDEVLRSDIQEQYETFILSKTALTVEPIVQAAKFLRLQVNGNVYYNPNKTRLSNSGIANIAKAAVSTYSSTSLGGFNKTFKASNVTRAIDVADPSISSSLLDIKMVIDIKPTRNVSTPYILEFGNAIDPDTTYTDAQLSQYVPAITSNSFTYQNKIVSLQDNGTGRLDFVQRNSNGTVNISKRNVGSVDYTTGILTISNVSIQDYTDSIRIYATPVSANIEAPKDRVLLINSNDINITAIAKRE